MAAPRHQTTKLPKLKFGRHRRRRHKIVHANWMRGKVTTARLNPFVQTSNTFMNSDSWLPTSHPAELTRIRNVIALIRSTPVSEADPQIATVELCQQIK